MISEGCRSTISPNYTCYSSDINLTEDKFDNIKNETGKTETVKRFTLSNKNGIRVEIINYGATITRIIVPDKTGNLDDVVLGFDDITGYQGPNNPYFGCIVGRVANRIQNGKFSLGNHVYNVTVNRGTYHLHGGKKGFDKVLWESHVDGNKVTFTYLSACGEEGYPGDVLVQATYQLSPDNELILDMMATSTKLTPINLTNHSYFSLAGHNKGSTGVSEQTLCINADKYTVVDKESIPTGELRKLAETNMDLRVPRLLAEVLKTTGGIDHNYCINQCSRGGLTFVARATHPPSGRTMEVYSDQPGVQLYTANYLPDPSSGDKLTVGKNGANYMKHGAFCLETQNFPDAVNHENFPNSILKPGYTYKHTVVYRFGVLNN
ncbi:galactose mutarotase-like [Periplaneta americana]|uniref:galactose mutarotase-like n=1 Tax=Periplaneta americana TaxID=6978 RepID=UPI0037E87420